MKSYSSVQSLHGSSNTTQSIVSEWDFLNYQDYKYNKGIVRKDLSKKVKKKEKPISNLKLTTSDHIVRETSSKSTRNKEVKSFKLGISKERVTRKITGTTKHSNQKSFKKLKKVPKETSPEKTGRRSNSAKIDFKRFSPSIKKARDKIRGLREATNTVTSGENSVESSRNLSTSSKESLKFKREFFKNKFKSTSKSNQRNSQKEEIKKKQFSSLKRKLKQKKKEDPQENEYNTFQIESHLVSYDSDRKKSKLLFEDVQLILTELGFLHSGGRQAMKKDPRIDIHKERDLLDDLWMHMKGDKYANIDNLKTFLYGI